MAESLGDFRYFVTLVYAVCNRLTNYKFNTGYTMRSSLLILLLLALTLPACSGKATQPTSKYKALVKYQGTILTDVRVDILQELGAEWKVVASGLPTVTEPFYFLPVSSALSFDPTKPTRVTIESVGAGVLPIKSIYQDQNRSPIKLTMPANATDPIVLELPDGAIGK